MEIAKAETDGGASEEISYVVHGAKIYCECGSRWGRLIVPVSHGVYLRQKAQLNKKDSKPLINVQSMGICSAGLKELENEQQEEKKEKKSFWKTVKTILFGKKDKEEEKQEVLLEDRICECIPEIAMDWQNTKEDVLVDGEEALLNKSFLVCMKGGATIKIYDNGQYD